MSVGPRSQARDCDYRIYKHQIVELLQSNRNNEETMKLCYLSVFPQPMSEINVYSEVFGYLPASRSDQWYTGIPGLNELTLNTH